MSKKKTEKTETIDISSHILVPKHLLLTKEESQEVLEKYHIKPYRLPHIKRADPAIRDIKAQVGDIVKIIRRSSTAGEAIVYRYVIE
ncbi:DNA-directed RNA polymerase subunit H [Candidatus Bathyarchaeota archaeon]|nr:DNA-directed RNA polymerase subunit H [Candidatus Bathyarchaeota archaeon]